MTGKLRWTAERPAIIISWSLIHVKRIDDSIRFRQDINTNVLAWGHAHIYSNFSQSFSSFGLLLTEGQR